MATNIDLGSTSYISQRIASNLNIQDLTPQSKLGILVNGLENESSIFENYRSESLNNFYLQTASEDYIEYAAASEGLSRVKEPLLRVLKEDAIVSIVQTTGEVSAYTLTRGETLSLVSGESWLVLTEDVTLEDYTKIFLSCDIKTNTTTNSIGFGEGSTYDVVIGNNTFTITFEQAINIPIIEETLENFRERLIYAKNSPRAGSESAIRLVFASADLLTDYTVNFKTNPYKALVFTSALFEDDTAVDTLTLYVIPALETQLALVKSEGSSFNIDIPKKVNLSIKLRALNSSNTPTVPYEFYTFKDYIQNRYKVGQSSRIDRQTLINHLEQQGASMTFLDSYEFVIFKNFLGKTYESTLRFIDILEDEYPYIEEVIIE